MKFEVKPFELKLINPFGISRNTRTSHKIVLLECEGSYFGEASPYAYYGETIENVTENIEKTLSQYNEEDFVYIDWMMNDINKTLPDHGTGSPKNAIDIMLHDYAAKKAGMPLYKFLGLKHPEKKQTSFTIGIDTIDMMLKKVDDAKDHPLLKIKLGRDFEQDLVVMKEIRKMTDKPLRVDANGGWSAENAVKGIKAMADLGVEYVEQPLERGSFEQLKKIKKESPLPIFLDEDVHTSKDLIFLSECCHGINIKLMKCGGIHEAMKMLMMARVLDLETMLGCMLETSVSITAAAHLSSIVDHLDLDGNILISNDPFRGMTLEGPEKYITLQDRPGLGVVPVN